MNSGCRLTNIHNPHLRCNLRRKFENLVCGGLSINNTTLAALLIEDPKVKTSDDVNELVVWDWRTGEVIYVSFYFPFHPCQTVNV